MPRVARPPGRRTAEAQLATPWRAVHRLVPPGPTSARPSRRSRSRTRNGRVLSRLRKDPPAAPAEENLLTLDQPTPPAADPVERTNIAAAWVDAARTTGCTGTDDEIGDLLFYALCAVTYSPEWIPCSRSSAATSPACPCRLARRPSPTRPTSDGASRCCPTRRPTSQA